MDERARRLWAGTEAEALGWGGIAAVARATGAISTVTFGRNQVRAGVRAADVVHVRRKGGGRRLHEVAHPELVPALEKLVDPVTRGDPESPLRWTSKSTHALSAEMFSTYGLRVGDKTVARLLRGQRLQPPGGEQDRRRHPASRSPCAVRAHQREGAGLPRPWPVISVDTKKKELVGNFKNAGRDWQPQGEPELVDVHDFPDDAVGKAIPYGAYDVAANDGFVNVGTDHDTPVFAVTSIETWWKRMGAKRYPDARDLFITADAGGSNGYRLHVWKAETPRIAVASSCAPGSIDASTRRAGRCRPRTSAH